MDRADTVIRFAEEIDKAVVKAMAEGWFNHHEIADELRRIAEEWEAAA